MQGAVTDPLAVALGRKALNGEAGSADSRMLASGAGWRVVDVLCTSGPGDRPFEERYWSVAISLVLAGTFSYRSAQGSTLMSPGTLLLGNVGSSYECSHEHGQGDRCLSFQFDPGFFEDVANDSNALAARFAHHRVPPLRELAPLNARAALALNDRASFEELAVELAGTVLRLSSGVRDERPSSARDRARVAAILQHLETNVAEPQNLEALAQMAGLSRYHFLRSFRAVTGVTPHQWLLRARLREAACRLVRDEAPVTEIALDVGFEDLSNFIRSFHSEFGIAPGKYRANA